MKKKGFCFKRAVSLLLAAVMIVTAAPQTSLNTLAAEQGMTIENPDVSEDLEILTAEDGTDADGDESADVPSDNGAGVGSDEQTADPGNADQSDDAGDNSEDPDGITQDDDAGDSDETADPEEGMDNELTTDDESVPGNDLAGGMSVFGNESDEESDEGPIYKGMIREPEGDEGLRLIIDETEATNANVEIAEILTYYAKQIEAGKCGEFYCVEFDVSADSSNSISMKQDEINGSISIMDTEKSQIDYLYWIDGFEVTYSLCQPREVTEDISNVNFTVTQMSHQGVKINANITEFPAESVGVLYNKHADAEGDAFAECWDRTAEEDLRLVVLDNDSPSSVIESTGIWFNEGNYTDDDNKTVYVSGFGVSIEEMQAGQDYLITPLYADKEPVATGTTKELTAGVRSENSEGVSEAVWKSLDESLITIEAGESAAATLTAKDQMGKTYYYVTYKCDDKTWLELHSIQVALTTDDGKTLTYVGEAEENEFEDGDHAGTKYRRLIINEGEAKEKNEGAEIADILTYWEKQITAEKCEKFNCVELNMEAVSSSETLSFPMKKDDINGALSIMDTEQEFGYWIDYSFWNEADNAGVHYTLFQPRGAEEGLDAACTVTLMPRQGVKINLKTADFPAEFVSVSYNKNQKDAFAECWDGVAQEDLRVLALDDGVSPGVIEPGGMWFDKFTFEDENGNEAFGSNFGMDIEGMQAGQDYLITPLYADKDSVATGTTKELTAGMRSGSPEEVSDVAWKSLDESLITIEAGEGAAATLTAKDETGEAYYYVTYKCDDQKWLELHSVQVADEASDGKLPYVGEVRQDVFEDGENAGTPYWRLVINEGEARDLNNGAEIADILTYYAEQIEAGNYVKFNCVEFSMDDPSSPMKKDNINGAVSIMDTENEQIGYWIDYILWNGADNAGVIYALSQPRKAEDDLNVTFAVTRMPNQGVKINAKTTEFPAESVSVTYYRHEENAFAACWDNARPEDLRLLALDDGVSPSVIESDGVWFGEYQFENEDGIVHASNFDINIEGMQAGHDYLITPLYVDRVSVAMGTTSELHAGERSGSPEEVSDVAWKSLDESLITIEPGEGAAATLTAQNETGEAYYYVTYKCGDQTWLELHSVQVVYGAPGGDLAYIGEIIRDRFEDGDLAGKTYLRLRIDEAEAAEKNKSKDITPILKFYKEKELKVNCVEFVINEASATDRVVKKDYINNALPVMDTENNEIGCWIDYIFQKYELGKELLEYTAFSLNKPGPVDADINVNVTVTPVAGQGVKLKFPAVDFNAEHVTVNFGSLENWDEIKAILEGAGGEGNDNPYRLFPLKSGQPVTDDQEIYLGYNAGCDMSDKRFWVNDVRRLKADTEYLMAPVKNVESMNIGTTKDLSLSVAGATEITWKSYTPNVISINTKNGKSELSAQSRGEALYGVTYKESNVQKAQFYRMDVESELYKIDFLDKEIEMEVGNENYLDVVCYPSDAGIDSGDLEWTVEPADSEHPVIGFIEEDGKMRGRIIAGRPGKVTVTATYHGKKDLTATCTITVTGRLDWEAVQNEVEQMDLYAVSGCDTKLSDVKFPKDTISTWKWKNPDLSLAPYAGSEGHMFTAVCTRDGGWSGEHTLYVRMINVTGITMKSRVLAEDNVGWTDWNQWWVPTALEKDKRLSLGFWYNMDGIKWNNVEGNFDSEETAAVEKKLAEKYKVEWSSTPNNLGKQLDDGTYEYTAAVSGTKVEKKTFTVSLKDKTANNKVVWKVSHTLTVTPNPLFDDAHWKLIDEAWKTKEIDDTTGKLTGLTLKIKMSKAEYDKWKLKFDSLDSGILRLEKPTVTEETSSAEGKETKTTVVKIPCTQKSFGRVWIKVTAQDDDKSSEMYDINLEDPAPTLLGAATQTINKASTTRSVPIEVRASADFPLAMNTQNRPDVSIQEVKNGGKDASGYFELTDVSVEDVVYSMKLGLKGDPSGVKAGNYAVKLKCKTTAAKDNEYTLSLTVKVTDVKPKVTFKQTKKVNLFYTDDEGAGTLQINTSEMITNVILKDYEDKNPNKNALCHYEVKQVESGRYQVVRKSSLTATTFNEKLKKGTLEYTVEGYEGTFQTTFTVATENKAPTIVLSTKSDTLYPNVGYPDSWITMTDKATGDSFVPNKATYYVGKGTNRKEVDLPIGAFDHENPEGEAQIAKEITITGNASKNTYRLFVTNDGNIVSRFRGDIDPKNGKKTDTINLELKKDNWSKPVAVSYKLQVNSLIPKLTLGKATLTLNKNADVYRGQQERTTLRLKGFNDLINNDSWVTITWQDDKSKAELVGKDSSLAIWYWNDCGDVVVRFNDNDIAAGTYKFKISVGKNGESSEFASTVLTVKIVDKAVKQSLKVTAKGSIDVLNREGTFIAYTPKISNLTGTVEDGWLDGKDANLFDWSFEDGKLIVKAQEWTKYSTKITYEVHTVFRVRTEDWRGYEISSDNDAKAKPFKIKVKQGKPKLMATAVGGNTLYRQRNNSVEFRLSAMLGKQDVAIEDAGQTDYWSDLWMEYDWNNQIVRVGLINNEGWGEIRKNGTYKPKITVRYRDKAGDVKEAQITCPIVVR